MTSPASELGKLSWKKRKKGKSKKEMSAIMSAISNARFDKTTIPKPNV